MLPPSWCWNERTLWETAPLNSILACAAKLGLEPLNLPMLEHTYASMLPRIIIIDFNGTLVRKEPTG